MSFSPQEVAAAYALNVVPRMTMRASTSLELHWERPFQEYRIIKRRVERSSSQLTLRWDEE